LKNLVLGSIFLLLLGSCSFSLFNGYRQGIGSRNSEIAPVSWFSSDTGHFLLNARIDLKEKHFTGLMIIKPLEGDAYRVVFITEMGLKIFDLELTPGDKVKVHSMMDGANRNAFIKILVHDLNLMLMTLPEGKKTVLLHDRHTGDPVLKCKYNGRRNYYHFPAGEGRASEALQTGCMIKKARAVFYGSPIHGIDSVKITHYNIHLCIQMYRIIQTQDHADE
jgi:hypothetical protein